MILKNNFFRENMSSKFFLTRMKAEVYAIISGLLWAASFPPMGLGFLAFFALLPLFWALIETDSPWKSARLGYIWAFSAAAGALWWIWKPTALGMFLTLFVLGVNGIFVALFFWLAKKRGGVNFAVAFAPIIIVAVEYLRSLGALGFPWLAMGYALTPYNAFVQIADIFGIFGLSMWVAATNSCMFFISSAFGTMRTQPKLFRNAIFALAALFATSGIYGIIAQTRSYDGKPVRVALLQSNVDPYLKWTREAKSKNALLFAEMILAVDGAADIVIMPETATSCYHRARPAMFSPIVQSCTEIKTPVLSGTLDYTDDNRDIYFNSAVLIEPNGTFEKTYNKIRLVPYDEYIPLEGIFKPLRDWDYPGSHFTAGDSFVIFDGGENVGKFGVMICYESLFGWIGREFRKRGAGFLMNITNDGWFGITPGPYQHAAFNVVRAIETRTWIARCANTGTSMFIDPHGKIVAQTSIFEKCILVGTIFANDVTTPYMILGDFVGWVCVILLLAYAFRLQMLFFGLRKAIFSSKNKKKVG